MLTALKFVQGAIAKKDFLPALTHFAIENGTVRGYNGTIALCCPIPFDIACKPKAEPLVRAIGNCADTVHLALTATGRLSVKSAKFKAFIDCVDGETPHVLPSGKYFDVDGAKLLAAFKACAPFIGEDASRAWASGILLRGSSAFATNNVTLVEFWLGMQSLPDAVTIPRAAVRELLRIDAPPTQIQYEDSSLTFHYEGSRWLRTQLLPADWPDLARILDQPSTPRPLDPRLFEGLAVVKPFTDKFNRVIMLPNGIATHDTEGEGAAYEIEGWGGQGVYNLEMLELLQGAATAIDFSSYPKPCLFFGENLRGAIIGMRE